MSVTTGLKHSLGTRLPDGMKAALRHLRFELAAGRVARSARPAFARLHGRTHLKLHLGAGDDIKLGWVNIDLALRTPPQIDPARHPDTVFINHDLRRGLPLDDNSCDLIYSSHFFEHLSFAEGLALMRESHRLLAPGGVFRMALPAFPALFAAYVNRDEAYFTVPLSEMFPGSPPDTQTFVDYVNYGVYQHGEHKAIYDEQKAVALLKEAGFGHASVSAYQEGLDPSIELRRRYSFYFEARK